LVGELYDYMLGIVIVGIIFISAVVSIPAITYINLQQIDQQQLRNTALNLFNAILLGTGSPVDWGSEFPFNQSEVDAFGLSISEQSSLYTVDGDKLQRLDEEGAGYIEYEKVKELLGLQDYDFRLDIFRPFMVNWNLSINGNDVDFSIDVTRNLDQRPVQNAEVSVTIFCAARHPDLEEDPMVNVTGPNIGYTNALGKYEGTEPIHVPQGYIVESAIAIFKITAAGISTMVVANSDQSIQNIMKINTFGDNIVLSFRGELTNTSAVRRILNINTFTFDEDLMKIYDGSSDPNSDKITEGYGYVFWNNTFPGLSALNPALLLFMVSVPLGAGEGGRRPVLVVGPYSFWESSEILSFGYPEQTNDFGVKLRRYIVDSSGMIYTAELLVWEG
jgi:hypothetical protein